MLLNGNTLFEFDEFVLDTSERTLWRKNETVPLTPKALETLCLLVKNQGKLMTKDDLMNQLWEDTFVEERNLAQNIFTLRKTLGENSNGKKFIETVPRRGYRFVAEVRPIEIEEDEFVEVSLAKQTTIRAEAEGNVSPKDLADAVKETARSLALDKNFGEKQISLIETSENPKTDTRKIYYAILGLAFIVICGGAFWSWQYYRSEANGQNIEAINFSNLKFESITDTGKAFLPALSRDKKQIVYVYSEKGKDSLRLQNLATGSVTEILSPQGYIGQPFFSADENYVYYRYFDGGKEGAIYRVPIFGGSSRKIVGEVRSDASISPDGNWISFVRYIGEKALYQIIVCQSDGSNERVVAERTGDKLFLDWGQSPAWSPDSRRIVVGEMTKNPDFAEINFIEINIFEGGEKVLSFPKWNDIGKIAWHPDGKGFVIIAQETRKSPYQIWYVSYPDGETQRITNDLNDYRQIEIAEDGEFILTSTRQLIFNLWLISLKDKQARQITFKNSALVGARGLNWSPDGKQIVFTIGENPHYSNIWTIDVETLEMHQLTFDEKKSNWIPYFTPDSSSIIFSSDRLGKSNIWQMDRTGGNLRQITNGESEGFPNVSPDGNWLFYVTPVDNPQFLYKRPFQGGEAILLYDNIRGHTTISPDGKRVVFGYFDNDEKQRDPWKYGIKSTEPDDKPQEISIKPHYASMAWVKDGSGFYYVEEGRSLNNIWFYNVADGKINPVTDFDDMKMRYLSLSPDGNQIVTARGSLTSEVIKISGLDVK